MQVTLSPLTDQAQTTFLTSEHAPLLNSSIIFIEIKSLVKYIQILNAMISDSFRLIVHSS